MKKLEIFLLILVLAFGIGLRSPELLNRNPLFGFDQGRDYLAIRKIVVEKKLTLIGSEVGAGMAGLQYIFHGPYFYYLLTIPFILFAGDPYGGLVLMFIFGVASLFLGCYLAWKAFGSRSALIATLLMSVVLYAQSRFIWNSHPSTFFILLVFYLVLKMPKNAGKYFFWACFWAGIIYGFQLAISVSLIVSLFLFAFFILKIRELKIYLRGIAGASLAYLPFFVFECRHGFMAIRSISGVFSKLLTNQSGLDWEKNLKEHFLAFWFNFRDTFYLADQWHFWLMIFLLITSFYYLFKQKKSQEKNFVSFLLLLPFVTFLIFIFLDSPVWGHYLIHLHLAYIFLFAFFATRSKLLLVKIIFSIFLILMLPNFFKEIGKAYADFYDHGGEAKMKGKLEAIDYLYQDAGDEKFNVLVFTPPVYDYAYRYLLGWYGAKKYGFVPGNKKEDLVYLWIEKDPQQPWSYQGWLETVIKEGKILDEKTLPSGFIIQKRYVAEK